MSVFSDAKSSFGQVVVADVFVRDDDKSIKPKLRLVCSSCKMSQLSPVTVGPDAHTVDAALPLRASRTSVLCTYGADEDFVVATLFDDANTLSFTSEPIALDRPQADAGTPLDAGTGEGEGEGEGEGAGEGEGEGEGGQ